MSRSVATLPPPPVKAASAKADDRSARAARRAPPPPVATFMVRLKPYNPKRGYKLKRYHVYGQRFDEDKGWYRVPETIRMADPKTGETKTINLVEYLRDCRQNQHDEDARPAFDVCTPEEARAIDAREDAALKTNERARPGNANDLTTRQVRGGNAEDSQELAAAKRRAAASAHRISRLADAPDEESFDPDADLGQ